MISANLAIRFLLEMTILAAAAAWTWRLVPGGLGRVAATGGVVVLVGTIWATVVHGSAVPAAAQLAAQVVIFAAATVAIAKVWRAVPAATFAGVALVNAVLLATTAA